jgi:Rod binding domain-containing protein
MSTPVNGIVSRAIPAGDLPSDLKARAVAPEDRQARKEDSEKIREAATQFEALLVAQMLRQVREAGSGGLTGDSEDKSGEHLMGFAEEQLAQVLSANGGLGIARMAAASLVQQPAPVPSQPSAASPAHSQPAKLTLE